MFGYVRHTNGGIGVRKHASVVSPWKIGDHRKSILFKTRLIFESDESPGESFGDSKHEIKGSDQIWYFAPIFLSDSIAKTLSVWLWHYILPTQRWWWCRNWKKKLSSIHATQVIRISLIHLQPQFSHSYTYNHILVTHKLATTFQALIHLQPHSSHLYACNHISVTHTLATTFQSLTHLQLRFSHSHTYNHISVTHTLATAF